MQRSEVGKTGERLAANYLQKNGYEILDLNYYNGRGYHIGEIDIIGKEKETGQLVFFEVKTRVQTDKNKEVLPEENVTNAKLKKIFKAINYYLQKESLQESFWRLDLIAIVLKPEDDKAELRHIKAIHY